MKKYITTALAKLTILFFVLCTTLVQAQEPTDLPDAPDDTALPIDDYIWVVIIFALVFAILKLRSINKKEIHLEE
jgi:hypothetical protein